MDFLFSPPPPLPHSPAAGLLTGEKPLPALPAGEGSTCRRLTASSSSAGSSVGTSAVASSAVASSAVVDWAFAARWMEEPPLEAGPQPGFGSQPWPGFEQNPACSSQSSLAELIFLILNRT